MTGAGLVDDPFRSLAGELRRAYVRAVDLNSATVHEQLPDLGAMTQANALRSVALNVLVEAGMTHADVADLLENDGSSIAACRTSPGQRCMRNRHDQGRVSALRQTAKLVWTASDVIDAEDDEDFVNLCKPCFYAVCEEKDSKASWRTSTGFSTSFAAANFSDGARTG